MAALRAGGAPEISWRRRLISTALWGQKDDFVIY
jgi:hypothetical protein